MSNAGVEPGWSAVPGDAPSVDARFVGGDLLIEGRLVADLQHEEGGPERNIRLTGQRVNGWFAPRYILALIGVWVSLITPASVTLALRVGQIDPEHKATSLALVASLGALAALFANPIFGALSHHSTSRFGQRRPFIIGGSLGGTVAIFAIEFAPSIGLVAAGWIVAQLCFNAAVAALIAILPERVPTQMRGKVSGWMGMTGQVGVELTRSGGHRVAAGVTGLVMLPR